LEGAPPEVNRDSPDGGLGQAEIAAVGGQRQDGGVAAARRAWRNLVARPEIIASIGMRRWAHVGVGQPL
jgi:hypothetical protein